MADVELTPTTAEERKATWAEAQKAIDQRGPDPRTPWPMFVVLPEFMHRLLADLDRAERELASQDASTVALCKSVEDATAKAVSFERSYIRERERAERAEQAIGTERHGNRLNTLTLGSKLAAAQAQAAEYRRALEFFLDWYEGRLTGTAQGPSWLEDIAEETRTALGAEGKRGSTL